MEFGIRIRSHEDDSFEFSQEELEELAVENMLADLEYRNYVD